MTEDGDPIYIVGSGMEAVIPTNERPGSFTYYPPGKDPMEDWKVYLDALVEAGVNRLRLF